jgi:hypothetical protein
MTARAILKRRYRRVMRVVWVGVGLYLLSIALWQGFGLPEALYVGLGGFAAAALGTLFIQFGGLRCPSCRSNLGVLVLHRGGLSLDRRIRFCPYCGVELDAELHAESTAEPCDPP